VNETDHGTFRESLGVARFMAISTKLEKKMWIWFKEFLRGRLSEFVSTIEEDYANLRNPDLPDYHKQIIIVTLKEK
jgi:hypothetical protein